MTEVKFYESIEDELLKFAVIISTKHRINIFFANILFMFILLQHQIILMEKTVLECYSFPISNAWKQNYIVKFRKL